MSRLFRALGRGLVAATIAALTLELSLRLLRPHHDGVRALLYQATLQTEYARIDSLPALMAASAFGNHPGGEVDGVRLNSRSFAGPDYSVAKAPGRYRVLAVGDSFTYCHVPCDAAWATLLEARLTRQRSTPVEVLNLGVPGTGTPFQLRLWQIEGVHLGADLVLQTLFVGNDFFDEQGVQEDGLWSERVATVSYAFRFGRNLLRWAGATVTPAPGARAGPSVESSDAEGLHFSTAAFTAIEVERMRLVSDAQRARFGLRLERAARPVEVLAAEARAQGTRFVVVLAPDVYQLDEEVRQSVYAATGTTPDQYELERPQRELAAFLAERGIEHVDLLPALRERSRDEALYGARTTHWSRAGNRVVAELLAERFTTGR